MLVSQSVRNFLGGVSQQDDRLRDPSQVETQTNCLTDPAHGLMKRPPFTHDAEIESDPSVYVDTLVHLINRDLDEKFRAVIRNGDLKVFDVSDGSEVTVYFPNGKDYLEGPDYRALTLGNTTFIVNQDKIVRQSNDNSDSRTPEALVFVRQGDFSVDYTVTVGSFSVTHTTSADDRAEIDTADIAQDILDDLEALDDFETFFEAERFGSTLYFSTVGGEDFKVDVRDGLADKGLLAVKDQVQRFEDLPIRAKDGFVVEVTGDPGTEYDNFWVVYDETDGPEDHGIWRETVAPGTLIGLDPSTMPHELVLEGALTARATVLAPPEEPFVFPGVINPGNIRTLRFDSTETYPAGYDITITLTSTSLGEDSFVITPGTDVDGAALAALFQAEIDGDVDYISSIIDDVYLRVSLASENEMDAPEVTLELDGATSARFNDLDLNGIDVVGATVRNITDGSEGEITAKEDNFIVASGGLSGGIDNTFERLDKLEIVQDGTYFVFREGSWRDREVGDLETNPFPDFVDRTITDITFYQNRLGFIFGDQLHFSAAGDLLNLFRITAATLRADDIIAARSANSVVSAFHSAIVWDKSLYLVAETGVTLVSGGQVFSPETIRMDFIAAYENSPEIPPIVIGQSLLLFRYFEKTGSVQVQEVVRQEADVLQRVDLTRHIPSYLQGEPLVAFGSAAQGFIGLVTEDGDDTRLWVYRFFDDRQQRVMSSWSEWTLPSGMTIVGGDVVVGEVGLVVTTEESVVILTADLDTEPTTADSKVKYLDRRVTDDDATPVHAGGTTTWTLPYDIATNGDEGTLVIYRTDTMAEIAVTGRPQTDEVTASGDFSAVPVFIGLTYEQKLVPSTLYYRDPEGRPDTRGNLSMRFLELHYHNSTDVTITVTPSSRSAITKDLDLSSPGDGTLRVGIFAQDYTLVLTNDTPGSFNLTSLDWEAIRVVRSLRKQ